MTATLPDMLFALYPHEFRNPKSPMVQAALKQAMLDQKKEIMNDHTISYAEQAARLEKEKAAGQQCNPLGAALCGHAGLTPAQPSLRERVAMNLNRAQQEARRTEALHELQYLFEKNPDIARIFDLLEVAGVR